MNVINTRKGKLFFIRCFTISLILTMSMAIYLPTRAYAYDSVTHFGVTVSTTQASLTGVGTEVIDGLQEIVISNTTDEISLSGTASLNTGIVVNPGTGNVARVVLDGLNITGDYKHGAAAITVLSGRLELIIKQNTTNKLVFANNAYTGGIILYNQASLLIDGIDKSGELEIKNSWLPGIGTGVWAETGTNSPEAYFPTATFQNVTWDARSLVAGDIDIRSAKIIMKTSGSGSFGACLGVGMMNTGATKDVAVGDISIGDSDINIDTGSGGSTGIGGGRANTGVSAPLAATVEDITISNSAVSINAGGMIGGVCIGGGNTHSNLDTSCGDIKIISSKVTGTALSNGTGALIGAGATMGNDGVSNSGDIDIIDSTVNLQQSGNAAMCSATIGGGGNVNYNNTSLRSGDIRIKGSNLTVSNALKGACIGAGGSRTLTGDASSGDIEIIDTNITHSSKNNSGAIIGGGFNATAGSIYIEGGTINAGIATPLASAAGIGGGTVSLDGASARAGDITISGASVAIAAGNGASIGAGFSSNANADVSVGDIIIEGNANININNGAGTVTPAIGGGYLYGTSLSGSRACAGKIIINSGNITANMSGYQYSTAIGAGRVNGTSLSYATVGEIIINGGKINAQGGAVGGAGIGGGRVDASMSSAVASVGAITINGGTILARATSTTESYDIGSGHKARSTAGVGSITIQGGSLSPYAGMSGVVPAPKNANGDPVYMQTWLLESLGEAPNTKITAGDINNLPCVLGLPTYPTYGIQDVWTDVRSEVHPWLAASSTQELVVMQIGNIGYVNAYQRHAVETLETLYKTVLSSPSAFIDPDGSLDADQPIITKNIEFNILASSGAHSFPVSVNYYLNGDDTNIYTIDSTDLLTDVAISISSEGLTSITYWASDATDMEDRITKYFLIDTVAPSTSVNYASGEYDRAIELTLAGIDANGVSGSGIDTVYYTLSKNGSVVVSSIQTLAQHLGAPINLATNGAYELTTYSVDRAGNAENISTYNYTINIKQGGGPGSPPDGGGKLDGSATISQNADTNTTNTGDTATPWLAAVIAMLTVLLLLAIATKKRRHTTK
jgi:LPXTG-motif cell wall-anchored protein